MPRRNWTRDELVLAMNLYCQLPFGKLHSRNPRIIRLAAALDRSPASVAMKLCNLASLDPAHQQRGVRGLAKVSQGDREIWSEFHNDWSRLAAESERLRLQTLTGSAPIESALDTDETKAPRGVRDTFTGDTERLQVSQIRLAQRFFRRTVLASYDSRCCVSGIQVKSLLVASHILPWSGFAEHRANPCNGLCLSRLHDAAFDRGLITFDEEYRLVLSGQLRPHLQNRVLKESFEAFEGRPLTLPLRFRPQAEFLARHREEVFCGGGL